MGPFGFQELLLIFIIALVIFGPRKLPELGKSLGQSLAQFKRASNDLRSTLEDEIRNEAPKPLAPPASSTDPSNLPSPAAPETIARGSAEGEPDESERARGEQGS